MNRARNGSPVDFRVFFEEVVSARRQSNSAVSRANFLPENESGTDRKLAITVCPTEAIKGLLSESSSEINKVTQDALVVDILCCQEVL